MWKNRIKSIFYSTLLLRNPTTVRTIDRNGHTHSTGHHFYVLKKVFMYYHNDPVLAGHHRTGVCSKACPAQHPECEVCAHIRTGIKYILMCCVSTVCVWGGRER